MERAIFLEGIFLPTRKTIVLLLLVLFLFIFIPKGVLTPIASRSVANHLLEQFNAADAEVHMDSGWGWNLLFGRLPKVELEIEHGFIEGLPVRFISLVGYDVEFDPWELFINQNFAYKKSGSMQLEVHVEESGLNDYFWREVDPARNLTVVIGEDVLSLQGVVSVWNIPWKVMLEGVLDIRNQTALRFVPRNLVVEETRVPPLLLEIINEHYGLVVDFDSLPFPIVITDVQMEEGAIVVRIGVVE